MAVYLLWTGDPSDVSSYAAWQQWGIPISMAYFLGDFLWWVPSTVECYLHSAVGESKVKHSPHDLLHTEKWRVGR